LLVLEIDTSSSQQVTIISDKDNNEDNIILSTLKIDIKLLTIF